MDFMQTIFAPMQIIAETAQQLYLYTLQAMRDAEETPSTRDPCSIGSFWGLLDRPTKELRYITLILQNPQARLIRAPAFRLEEVFPRTILATLSDEIDIQTMAFYNSRALEFSDDHKTIPSNYGYRIRNLRNTNQINQVIAQLKKDPYSRRALIHIHSVDDLKKRYNPCIDSLHFLIRNGALECHSLWRSENALSLLPINLFEFTMLQELIASELEIPTGIYVHTVSSLHYYKEDQQKFDHTLNMLSYYSSPQAMDPMTDYSLDQVLILRQFENKLRNQLGNEMEFFSQLSPYWQQTGIVIAYAIANKTKNFPAMEYWKRKSIWKELLA
jgi:thymidylate synthase